jgi:hypothetical protein
MKNLFLMAVTIVSFNQAFASNAFKCSIDLFQKGQEVVTVNAESRVELLDMSIIKKDRILNKSLITQGIEITSGGIAGTYKVEFLHPRGGTTFEGFTIDAEDGTLQTSVDEGFLNINCSSR